MDDLLDQVQSTFSRNVTDESFSRNLNELVRNVHNIQATDLNFNPATLEVFNNENAKERYPPVTCIEIMETPTFTMAIFTLQKGARIPLHDHPDMHGIVKVIHGTVQVTSYSKISSATNEIEVPQDIKNVVNSSKLNSLIPVELKMSTSVTANDEPCLLTPTEGNYHEIQSIEGVAAIFDILSPPYGDRECRYFSVLESNNSNAQCKLWLSEETDDPTFWCV